MIAPTPVDRIAEVLTMAGYRRLSIPLEIAGLRFELAAAFLGTNPSPDLILVEDIAYEEENRILRKIEGIARAMDVVQSKRPLTVILAGPRPRSSTIEAMCRVCRVLPVGLDQDEDPDKTLKNWLSVLMPLKLPEPNAGIADPMKAICEDLEGLPAEVTGLVELARRGAGAVRTRLHEIISEPLEDVASEDGQ